jgi:pilus assembly protein FimV
LFSQESNVANLANKPETPDLDFGADETGSDDSILDFDVNDAMDDDDTASTMIMDNDALNEMDETVIMESPAFDPVVADGDVSEIESSDNSLDFDMDFDSDKTEEADLDTGLEFDLTALEDLDDLENLNDLDGLDGLENLDDLEVIEETSDNAEVLKANVNIDDEIDTMIELAQAYADMEDFESAVSASEEIILRGNDVQKEKARSLLAKLRNNCEALSA